MVTKKYCWLMLLLAIILEITGTALMKFFAIKGGMEGYILMLLFIFCSYFALSKAILTYSPCLKAGDSWIQTILAY